MCPVMRFLYLVFSFLSSFLFLFFLSFFLLNVDNGHCAVAVGYTSWRNMQSLSRSFHLSLSLSASLFLCLTLPVSHTKTHTIIPHRATKDTPTPSLTHTHPHHTQGIQWLPRTIDTWTHFYTWEISGPPHPHNPIRAARQNEDCKDTPPALPSRVLFQEEADSRIRTTFTGCRSHLQVQKRGHRKAQVMLYSVCLRELYFPQ